MAMTPTPESAGQIAEMVPPWALKTYGDGPAGDPSDRRRVAP